jgi:hypothetical protein
MRSTNRAASSASARRSVKSSGSRKRRQHREKAATQGKEGLGANFDHQHVHQELDELLIALGQLRHFAALDIAGDAGGSFGNRVGALAEHQVAGGEPHGVVRALAGRGRIAALVRAVGVEQAGVEMARRRVGNVLHHQGLHVRRRDGAQGLSARLDDAGDGE